MKRLYVIFYDGVCEIIELIKDFFKIHHLILFLVVFNSIAMVVHHRMPDLPEQDYFAFADQKITIKTHVYFVMEHVSRTLLLIALSVATTEPRTKKVVKVCAILEGLVIVDYLLTYQNGYLTADFDSNTIKLVVSSILAFSIILVDIFRFIYEKLT